MVSVRLMQALLPAPESQQFPTIVAIATCTWGIISLWAATSQRPWYIRASVLCLLLSFLVAIPAYEPVLYFLLQSAVAVLGVAIWSANPGRNGASQVRFSLRELLFITVFVALFLSILARMDWHPPMVWASLFATGLANGVVTLLAAWLSLPRPTWSRRLRDIVVAVLLTSLSAIPAMTSDGLLLNFPDWQRVPGAASDPAWMVLLLGILFGIYLWLLLWSWASRYASQGRYVRLSRLGLLAWSIVLVAPCIDLYFSLPPRQTAPELNVVEDNGFKEIEAALKLYVPNAALDDSAESTSDQIRVGLKQNAETLVALRRGLSKKCIRELDYDTNINWNSILGPIQKMRSIARMLIAEGELAEREGRIDDAIVSYVDLMRLSHATEKGGLLVDALVARAIEGMAFGGISGIRDQLTPL